MERHHRVYLAPMVDGSELAFRMLCRAHGACAAYTPMLRAGKILLPGGLLAAGGAAGARVEEDRPLIVQLCGREPLQLAAAAKALLTHYHGQLDGIDLNLGCPQEIARREGIGAFLAADQALACRCVAALAEAVAGTDVSISAKIRLVEPPEEEEGHSRDPSLYLPQNPGPQNQGSGADREEGVDGKEAEPTATAAATVAFARRLVSAGCSLLACHCRRRDDKHNGPPDLVTGAALVRALAPIPVVINGGVATAEDVRDTLAATGAHGVMVAQGFLRNHRMLLEKEAPPQSLAAEYLDYCATYMPPSPYYIRKHLRHIFRAQLQGPGPDAPKPWRRKWQREAWRNRMWHLISRNHLSSIWQFRQTVHLYCVLSELSAEETPASVRDLDYPTFKSIRYRKKKKGKRGNGKRRKDQLYSYQHLN
jgi:tRNA-dihydrouridine synthase